MCKSCNRKEYPFGYGEYQTICPICGEYVGDCLGYRISSPSAKDDYDSMSFSCDGLVMPEYYEGDFVSALRPVIKLPNSVFSE